MEVESNSATLKASVSGFSILIVDDESATRELCRDIALEMGLEVRTASTTDEALQILDEAAVDIVVTDLRVPELGGSRASEAHQLEPAAYFCHGAHPIRDD